MDYKEKYEQALEVAQRFYNNSVAITKKGLEDIFPELKESIDERIKKVIKQVLSESTTEKDECYLDNGVTQQEVFAWLEKQGEQKTIEEVNGEDYGIDSLWHAQNILERTLGKVEGYQSDDGILEHECAISAVKKLYEHSAWSEEDEKFFKTALWHICNSISNGDSTDIHCDTTEWFKSLKDRVQPQPKQEWSEDDERYLNNTISYLKDATEFKETAKLCIDWLKSLRPQNRWKPSDEQMEVLVWCKPLFVEPKLKGILESLINDLKRLMEE